jgi:hypothetical protein
VQLAGGVPKKELNRIFISSELTNSIMLKEMEGQNFAVSVRRIRQDLNIERNLGFIFYS